MKKRHSSALFKFLFFILHVSSSFSQRQVYIVYVGEHSGEKTLDEIKEIHHSYLHTVKGSKEEAKASLIYSYKNVINGFSALLTPEEAIQLSEMEDVVSVFKSEPRRHKLQTTRSWDFVNTLNGQIAGLNNASKQEEYLRKANYGKDVIVGVLDSGIWPESQSFSDEGMDPIPETWNGTCEEGVNFNSSHCNGKIIGARYYLRGYESYYGPLNETEDYRSARDKDGHGTHTASTVGGRSVSVTGFANGTASGGATLVRLAIYKVCWPIPGQPKIEGNTCFDEDMLAAFDDAIADGVHVISFSIVPFSLRTYLEDSISIGSLHAVKRDIVVVCSAGNNGIGNVRNVAPWIITVAASSIDRIFSSPIILGNGVEIPGQTVTEFKLDKIYPLVYAGDVEIPGSTTSNTTGYCLPNTLFPTLVEGKIVLCFSGYSYQVEKGLEVKRAGGVGLILQNFDNGMGIIVNSHFLPATEIFAEDAYTIFNYIRNTTNPMATITPVKTLLDTKPAPFMASFSATGPNDLEPNILKPDITAPGLNILAAWSEGSSPTKLDIDNRIVKYNILSGTSMSCPHVSASAALIKAIHPNWSSAAIRSALMTTAGQKNNVGTGITDVNGDLATPFHYGSGHFDPAEAADPGLVYDATYADYLLFLCSGNVTRIDSSFNCPPIIPTPNNLNYPSIAINKFNGDVTLNRTVTNVGDSNSVYNLTINDPRGYSVEIFPTNLQFTRIGEKRSFSIRVKEANKKMEKIDFDDDMYSFGSYIWSDGIHRVKSPIAVRHN